MTSHVRVADDVRQRGFSLVEMMMVVCIIGVLGAIAIPMTGNSLRYLKLSGDARDVANATAVTKMRAAAKFTNARLYLDVNARTFYIQTYTKGVTTACPLNPNGCWQTEGGPTQLSNTVTFAYGPVTQAPPDTQTTIGLAPACRNNGYPVALPVANTACLIFNSRGIPVDHNNNPTGLDAVYVTDGTAVYGITVAATGFIRTWRTNYVTTPTWTLE